MTGATGQPEFDAYASHYREALDRGIAVSGESKEYFAHGRVAWLAGCLRHLGAPACRVLDFGCGTGTATPFLLDVLDAGSVVGVDISEASVAQARAEHPDPRAVFALRDAYALRSEFDVAYCNGVFHHIPPPDRAAALTYIYNVLKPGGIFALWENNPWNPGTQLVMRRIPFDRDAVKLSAPKARRLLWAAGLQVLATDFLFVFPHAMRALRRLEPGLSRLPLGAQYQVLARKPKC